MKNIVVNTIALLAFVFSATAQESIERISSEYGSISLIRQNDIREWIVYSSPSDFCDFMKVIDVNNQVDILRLPLEFSSVSDFEIDYGVVYFCGMMEENVPCMGYFLSGPTFPNVSVNYITFPTLERLKKLEVMSDDYGTKVIMTGRDRQSDVVVEATSAIGGGAWTVNIITPYLPGSSLPYSCDDIAIIDSCVVVTTNTSFVLSDDDSPSPNPISGLWYFPKPPITPIWLTSSSVKLMEITDFFPSVFCIKKCENNTFVVAGTIASSLSVPYICGSNMYTFIGSVTLTQINSKIRALDYNPDSSTLEVVIDPYDAAANGSEIYTLLPGMGTTPGVAYGRRFPEHLIKDLVYQGYNNPLHYICVGDNIGNNNDLFLYRYHYNQVIGCSDSICVNTRLSEKPQKLVDGKSKYTTMYYVPRRTDPIIKMTSIRTICD